MYVWKGTYVADGASVCISGDTILETIVGIREWLRGVGNERAVVYGPALSMRLRVRVMRQHGMSVVGVQEDYRDGGVTA